MIRRSLYISCEYMHAMGNSCGNMDEYTALEHYPKYQGGFIWDFIDQAIYATQPDGTTSLRYGGDFGDRPSDYEFSGNGLVFADRKPTPKAQEVKQLYSNVHIDVAEDSVTIKNDNLFTSTGEYTFVLRVLADGEPVWQSERRFDVPAGSTEKLDVDWPLDLYRDGASGTGAGGIPASRQGDHWAVAGYELAFGQTVVAGSKKASAPVKPVDGIVTVGRWNVGVQGSGREVLLSPHPRRTGLLHVQQSRIRAAPSGGHHVPRADRQRSRRRPRLRTRPVAGSRPLRPLHRQRDRTDRREHRQGLLHVRARHPRSAPR